MYIAYVITSTTSTGSTTISSTITPSTTIITEAPTFSLDSKLIGMYAKHMYH